MAIVVVVLIVLVACGVSCHKKHKTDAQYAQDHVWEQTVKDAENYHGVDSKYTDLALAMIQVESSGDVNVDDYHDVMQAREGDGGSLLIDGLPDIGISACTPEASIYGGVLEMRNCLADFEQYMGRSADPASSNDMALVAQGYNYGHLGWFMWLSANGITEWSLEASEQYQQTIGGIGTANHGGKIIEAYERIHT